MIDIRIPYEYNMKHKINKDLKSDKIIIHKYSEMSMFVVESDIMELYGSGRYEGGFGGV